MLSIELLAEILGWTGLTVMLISNQLKTGKSILSTQGLGNAFWTAHFLYLGSISGFIVCLLCTARSFLGAYIDGSKLKWGIGILTAVMFISVYLTSNDLTGYFGATAATVISMMAFFKHKTYILRSLNLLGGLLWFGFALQAGSTSFITMEVLGILSIISGAIRHEDIFAPLREKLTLPIRPVANA